MSVDEPIQVLVVDDDEGHAKTVADALAPAGYDCTVATRGSDGLRLIEESTFDIIITDLVIDEVGGLEILDRSKQELPSAEVIIMTGHGTIRSAVSAMQAGAATYLLKPLDLLELRTVVEKASQSQRLARTNRELQRQLDERFGFQGVIGNSPQMHRMISTLRQVAPTQASVLILGENGTGKELVAKSLHYNSPRKDKPFVAVNCGALPETLVESELFGHIKGAFTGADRDRKGFFEQANGGTLFLDEVGELPPPLQVKLLRAVEYGEITRVGTSEAIQVKVRTISATNRDLKKAIETNEFREDLYHRLSVVKIRTPPLRERRDDIPLLTDHFLRELSEKYDKPVPTIAPIVRKAMMAYDWPGNIRELRNAIESMVVIDSDGILDGSDLTEELQGNTYVAATAEKSGVDALVGRSMDEVERYYITKALEQTSGNRASAAKMLGIGERTLYRKIREFDLE